MLQEHLTIGTSLGVFTGQVTVFLLRIDIGNITFLALEVKGYLRLLVLVVAHLKDRCSRQFVSGGVPLTSGMHQIAVKAHMDVFTSQVHIGVLHLGVTKEMGRRCGGIIDQRVIGRILHRGIDTVLPMTVDAVQCQRVINSLIMLVDGQLDGIHRRSVTFGLDGSFSTFRNDGIEWSGIILFQGRGKTVDSLFHLVLVSTDAINKRRQRDRIRRQHWCLHRRQRHDTALLYHLGNLPTVQG